MNKRKRAQKKAKYEADKYKQQIREAAEIGALMHEPPEPVEKPPKFNGFRQGRIPPAIKRKMERSTDDDDDDDDLENIPTSFMTGNQDD